VELAGQHFPNSGSRGVFRIMSRAIDLLDLTA